MIQVSRNVFKVLKPDFTQMNIFEKIGQLLCNSSGIQTFSEITNICRVMCLCEFVITLKLQSLTVSNYHK